MGDENENQDQSQTELTQQQQNQQQSQQSSLGPKQQLLTNYEQLVNVNREIKEQKKLNEGHRDQLKKINDKLNSLLDKQKPKKEDKYFIKEESDQIMKEISNANNQLAQVKAEYEKLNKNSNLELTVEKIIDYQVKIRENEKQKQTLLEEIKQAEKLNKDLQKKLEKVQDDEQYPKQILILTNEIRTQKEKLNENQKNMEIKQQHFQKQESYKQQLDQKYKEVCQKAGIEVQDYKKVKEEFMKQKNQPQKEEEKQKWVGMKNYINQKSQDDDISTDFSKVSKKQYDDLLMKYKRILQSEKAQEKISKVGTENIDKQISNLDFENQEIMNKIKEKEREYDLIQQKYSEIKKLLKKDQLAPLDFMSQAKISQTTISETEKILSKQCLEFKKRETKRDAKGGIFTDNVVNFDDSYQLDGSINHRIKKIRVYHNGESVIYGLQAIYEMENGEDMIGKENIDYFLKSNYQISELQMEENDQIKTIQGYATDSIDFLRIETQRQQVLEVGSYNLRDKPKEFQLNIEYTYTPITMFGGLDYKRTVDDLEYLCLAYIGVEMKNPFLPHIKEKPLQAQQLHMQIESQLHKQKLIQLNKIETIKKKYTEFSRKDLDLMLVDENNSFLPKNKNKVGKNVKSQPNIQSSNQVNNQQQNKQQKQQQQQQQSVNKSSQQQSKQQQSVNKSSQQQSSQQKSQSKKK